MTDQFIFALGKNSINITNLLEDSQNGHLKNPINEFKHQEDTNDLFLNMLLSEAQGVVRASLRLSDLTLASSGVKSMDAKQRFRLGVALSKIGLFELSLRHVSLSATPWEAPLYRLRAKLILPPVHKSIRALVQAVDTFETQAESILVQKIPKSPLMVPICNSLNEAALALQSLPLFHLVGVAAPRGNNAIGHSPVALPVLLSEVFVSMCQPLPMHPKFLMYVNSSDVPELSDDDLQGLDATTQDVKQMENVAKPLSKRRKNKSQLIIGIVAGSLDGITGQIVIGTVGRRVDIFSNC